MKSGFMIGKSRDQCYILVSDWLPAWWASYNTEIVSYLHPARFQCGPANDPGPQMIPVPPMIPKLDLKRSQDRKWFLQMVSQKIENGVDSMNSPWMYIFFNCAKWRQFNYEIW